MDFNLKEKLGPLPVWGWGAIVAVVALAAYYFIARSRAASSGTGTVANGTSDTSGSNIDATGYHTAGINGGSATAPQSTVQSNQSWLSSVSATVADTLHASPSTVYAAISKWLDGETISTTEQGYVDKAIQMGGNPPEGVMGTSAVTPDAPNGNVYYVPQNKSWALIKGDGSVEMTSSLGAANAWATDYETSHNAETVTPDQWTSLYAAAKAKNPSQDVVVGQ